VGGMGSQASGRMAWVVVHPAQTGSPRRSSGRGREIARSRGESTADGHYAGRTAAGRRRRGRDGVPREYLSPPVPAAQCPAPAPAVAPDAPGRQRLAWQTAALLAAVGAAHGLFSWAVLARHRTYHSEALDLGWFDQIVWNTAHGHGFRSSFVAYHTLGEHFSPVLLLFAALYRARPEVELLLLIQAAGVTTGEVCQRSGEVALPREVGT
jgi:hypothetical protein